MKILIIDDSESFRVLMRRHLQQEIDAVEVIDYDPTVLGKPGRDFDWSVYDVLLLDYKLSANDNGLVWLKEFRSLPDFPPTLLLTAEGNEYVAVTAIKLGAANYLSKVDITAKQLAKLVREAEKFSIESSITRSLEMESDLEIVRDIDTYSALPGGSENIGYKFVRKIGEGAMSKVYLAERISDQKNLVLKILDFADVQDESLVDRFILESELLADINSPYIVQIYDRGLTDNYGYIAMEFFGRGDLKQRMDKRLHVSTSIAYIKSIAKALAAIHKVGIVHRDLKPANIMFRSDDSLALADFGISKRQYEEHDMTKFGEVVGTPYYMSPEQGEGQTVDARSDLYSLGVLFYELLTNTKPYGSETCSPLAIIFQHVHSPVPSLPEALAHYEPVLKKLLAKLADERYQSANEFLVALEKMQAA